MQDINAQVMLEIYIFEIPHMAPGSQRAKFSVTIFNFLSANSRKCSEMPIWSIPELDPKSLMFFYGNFKSRIEIYEKKIIFLMFT